MQPTLLHQLADEQLERRNRVRTVRSRRPSRPARATPVVGRLRSGAGALLIAAGHRLAGPRAVLSGLHGHPTR